MLKQSKWNIADTNLANFGSAEEKRHHHDEGAKEAAWAAPTSKVGKATWVILCGGNISNEVAAYGFGESSSSRSWRGQKRNTVHFSKTTRI